MRRDSLDILTAKLLKRCGIHQNNQYGNGDWLVALGPLLPNHPIIYRFMKHTWFGKKLERRWAKRAHKRIAVHQ